MRTYAAVFVAAGGCVAAAVACSSFSDDAATPPPLSTDAGDEQAVITGRPTVPYAITIVDAQPLAVLQGKSRDVAFSVERRDGYAGALVVSGSKLPAGVHLDPVTVPAGQASGTLALRADPASPQGSSDLTVELIDEAGTHGPASAPVQILVRGAPGTLDETFGKRGVTDFPHPGAGGVACASITVQADGKIVYGGRASTAPALVIGRLLPTGLPDKTFASTGFARRSLGSEPYDGLIAALPQADGKIVVVGVSNQTNIATVFRLGADGAPDASFGTGGQTAFASTSVASARLMSDGGVVMIGSHPPSPDADVVKLRADGTVDVDFGVSGHAAVAGSLFGAGASATPADLLVDASGLYGSFIVSSARAGIARLALDGKGTPVVGQTTINESTQFTAPLVRSPDGRVIIAFANRITGVERTTLYGFLPDVQNTDPNFGVGGYLHVSSDHPTDLFRDSETRLVLGVSSISELRVARFGSGGAADPSFGDAGVATASSGRTSRTALQADNRILACGQALVNGTTDFAIARFWD